MTRPPCLRLCPAYPGNPRTASRVSRLFTGRDIRYYIQIPLLFALGSAALTMVGVNIGAGQVRRAERIAWVAAFFAAGVTEILGLFVALFPMPG